MGFEGKAAGDKFKFAISYLVLNLMYLAYHKW